jgi:hypothetical protein
MSMSAINTYKCHAKQCPLLSLPKMEIKDKINGDKITFYIFNALNAHIPKQNFYINKLN